MSTRTAYKLIKFTQDDEREIHDAAVLLADVLIKDPDLSDWWVGFRLSRYDHDRTDSVYVHLMRLDGKTGPAIHGGQYNKAKHTITVLFAPGDYSKVSESLLTRTIEDTLRHEATHAKEYDLEDPSYDADAVRDQKGGDEYYGNPAERRAFLRNILDDISAQVSTLPSLVLKYKTGERALTKLLESSATWRHIASKPISEKVRNWYLDAVWTNIHTEGGEIPPANGLNTVIAGKLKPFRGTRASFTYSKDRRLLIADLFRVPRSAPEATRTVLDAVCAFADKYKLRIAISPDQEMGGSKAKAALLLKQYGFVANSGRNKDFTVWESMYRPIWAVSR